MITETVMLKELATAFAGIDNGAAFVVHCGVVNEGTKLIAQTVIPDLQRINSHNLFLSLNPLPYDQVDRVFNSATIGLVFYKKLDNLDSDANNMAQIASASGKLTHFLECGKPVLVSNLPSLVNILDQYPCGIVVEDPSSSIEVGQAIAKIMANYETYSFQARECFWNLFDFRENAKPILGFTSKISNLSKQIN
jgi:glycosyltransferase involved in cell wall biosynthesis